MKNEGFYILNPQAPDLQATYLVSGIGRSGTTMVSRILCSFNIPMSLDRVSHKTNEDLDFREVVLTRDYNKYQALVLERNKRFKRWGFKSPAARADLLKWTSFLRNPRVIFIFRDLLAVALRQSMYDKRTICSSLEVIANGYRKSLAKIFECNCPVFLMSYEKALAHPKEMYENLSTFCGVSHSSFNSALIKSVINNGDQRYFT